MGKKENNRISRGLFIKCLKRLIPIHLRHHIRSMKKEFDVYGTNRLFLSSFDYVSDERKNNIVMINHPLILISQIQRSGGTLMSQLFDDHPECFAHPSEIMWGKPKHNWPDLDLYKINPKRYYEQLYEDLNDRYIKTGYSKKPAYSPMKKEAFPFIFNKALQKKIFVELVRSSPPSSQREVLNKYMTSYFNAWLDYQDLYRVGKKYLTGFTPRVNMYPGSAERFFQDYPDGYMISIIRQPADWYVSAKKHVPKKYGDIVIATELWFNSTKSSLELKRNHPDQIILVLFEDLVQKTKLIMQEICKIIGLSWNNILTVPTFNSMPIMADSSFNVKKHGIIQETLFRQKELTEYEIQFIDNKTRALYKQAASVSIKGRR